MIFEEGDNVLTNYDKPKQKIEFTPQIYSRSLRKRTLSERERTVCNWGCCLKGKPGS